MMSDFKYIIGTGWWCNETAIDSELENRLKTGDDIIRGSRFHKIWSYSVAQYSKPDKVVIVDSNSPTKPNLDHQLLPYVYIELNENGGHATNMKGKYCGWSRSVLLSLEYARMSNCDYFIYIEQDVLLNGNGIIEYCINSLPKSKKYMFGRDGQRPQPLQQSFFIIRKEGIDSFVSNYQSIKYSDNDICPEIKFALSSSRLFCFIPTFLFIEKSGFIGKILKRAQSFLARMLGDYCYLPVGYGRVRPIVFDDSFYYFQHGTKFDIQSYMDKNKINIEL